MNAKIWKSIAFGSLMLVVFAVSACGTLDIEQAPATGTAEVATTATAMPLPTATEMPLPSPTALPSPTPTSMVQDEEINWDAEITSLDETWNLYTSGGEGFSIKFPKTMATFRGSCTWNQEHGSYRPQMAVVPVKIFEDADAVYIAPEYYFELAGERIEDNIHYYGECNQVTNSLELLRDQETGSEPLNWKLVAKEIHDDAELDGFLKDRYGSGCSLGEKEPTRQDGVYRVRIQGDGKAMEETQCLLNYGTVVIYYPEGNKVISWHTGQAATFPADVNYSVIHDEKMVESFNFTGAAGSTAQDEEIIWDSEITSLDETWNLYTSNGQGFSIKFPKTMASYGGSCTWNEEQGSYRPQNAIVPVKIFEDSDAVYIAPEYYYELAGERIEDHKSYYDECNQVANSLELLRDPENLYASIQMWKLVAKEIHDDAELEGFLKDRYGSGCSLGEKEPTGQDGVYRVRILGDGKDLGETQCPLNYGTVVKYYPAGNKVVAWDTGQAATFLVDVNRGFAHDGEMVESFSFIADTAPVAPGESDAPLTSYTNDDYGFSFQYPADWALEVIPRRAPDAGPGSPKSLADAIVLTKGDLVISIQHLRMSEPAGWDGRFSGGGPYQEASQEWVTLIGQESRKWVWTVDGGIKAIEVHAVSEAADLVLQFALYDSRIGDPAAEALPETAIGVLDGILSSFKLTQ